VIKNIPGFRRDFRAKMRGTSSPNDKLADDLGNAIEGTRINGCRSDFLTAGKLAPGNLGLLQQYLPQADMCSAAKKHFHSITSPGTAVLLLGNFTGDAYS
jgi:hypothetical protein